MGILSLMPDSILSVCRSSATHNEASCETRDDCIDALLGGWRSTHKRSKTQDQPLSYMEQGILGRDDDDARCFTNEKHGDRLVERDSSSGGKPYHVGNLVAKHGLTSRNQGECSTMVLDDSEVLFLGSSRESSSSRSSRVHNRQHDGNLEPIYEIDELLTEVRNNDPQLIGSRNDEDSHVTARQVEADEMLARELQERLYHEEPIFGGGEVCSLQLYSHAPSLMSPNKLETICQLFMFIANRLMKIWHGSCSRRKMHSLLHLVTIILFHIL